MQRTAATGQVLVRVTDANLTPAGGIVIKGVIENTSPLTLEKVEIDFHLRRGAGAAGEVVGTITYALPGALPSQRPTSFVVSTDECPQFDEYFYEIRFAPAKRAGAR